MGSVESIAAAVLDALDHRRQRAPFTTEFPEFSIGDAYAAADRLRRQRIARGSRPVGRKIGFTNRNIWDEYGVREPIRGDMFDDTVRPVLAGQQVEVGHLPEPRIEPEIVLELCADLGHGMSLAEIAGSVGRVAHGFEIVQSIYPGWRFEPADCVADGGLHGMLLLGPWKEIGENDRPDLLSRLRGVEVELFRNGRSADRGVGANALGGPIEALRHLVETLRDPGAALRAGEIVTTGTLTRAFPIEPGQRWSTRVEGFDLPGLAVELV